jgi:microcystin-dependent protein
MGNKLQHGHVDADDGGVLSVSIGIIPTGGILSYGGATAPSGYLLCDGSAVSRTTYSALFTAIGTAFGAGDGSTTFNVPDLRGRSPLGSGTGSGLTARSIGQTGGEENHALSVAELASHEHSYNRDMPDINLGLQSGTETLRVQGNQNNSTGSTGSGTAHNTMHPYTVTNFIIKT